MGKLLLVFIFLITRHVCLSQEKDQYILHIREATAPIQIDGILNEPDWEKAEKAYRFHRVTPIDTGWADAKTEVFMTYDHEKFYFGVVCYDDQPGDIIVESLRRDFSFPKNDNFLVLIDPFNDNTNGFSFGTSAAGAQWDGLIADGGNTGVSLEWDNKWESAVKSYENRWVLEMGIPFKTIRYKEGIDSWGINFSRFDLKGNEKSSWFPVPRQFPTSSLAFTGKLQWDKPPPPAGTNISLIPYMSGGVSKDLETADDTDYTGDIGGDAKIAITTALNLDLTINPDFSQVEVDQQVTNLDRFELFFPEQRQFFLENSDLFAKFGFNHLRPFFSRRIGLKSPIIAGARLSGKLNRDWRVGMMNLTTDKEDSVSLPAQNYTVAAVQRRVFTRSNIAALFVNQQAINFDQMTFENTDEERYEYNRLVGIDYNLASANNLWTGKFLLHKSFTPGISGNDFAHGVKLNYRTQTLDTEWNHEFVGEEFNAEAGFVPRIGYFRFEPIVRIRIYPESETINYHGPGYRGDMFWNLDWDLTDSKQSVWYYIQGLNTAEGWIGVRTKYIKLQEPFDPTNTEGDSLAAGTSYHWTVVNGRFTSDRRKKFNYDVKVSYGGYYNGDRTNVETTITYRYQPYGSISVQVDYNDIQLPDPYNSATFWLIGPKIDITFTDAIFWTTFIQYNNQIDNVNLNTRFQWRFKPVSDLFIIYSENYFTDNLMVKNRALILKLSYWFNL